MKVETAFSMIITIAKSVITTFILFSGEYDEKIVISLKAM